MQAVAHQQGHALILEDKGGRGLLSEGPQPFDGLVEGELLERVDIDEGAQDAPRLGQRIEVLEVVPVIPSQLVVAPGGIGHQALDPWWQIDAVIGPRGPQANDVRELVMRHQQLVILHAEEIAEGTRSDDHTSEPQSLMRNSYAI